MEFFFRQDRLDRNSVADRLEQFGIEQCLLKYISSEKDRFTSTRKEHHHSGFEVHIVEQGEQIYAVEGETVCVRTGHFLMIAPQVKHVAYPAEIGTKKYAITFRLTDDGLLADRSAEVPSYVFGETPFSVKENLQAVCRERAEPMAYGLWVMSNRIWECILGFFRICGMQNGPDCISYSVRDEDDRISIVKRYIEDNCFRRVSVTELASYCHMSEKQLTRIFLKAEGMTVSEYIRKKRCRRIEALLSETDLSLREISEAMGFDNEYSFNAFYKKYAGMPPGEFRKSIFKG